MLIGRGNRPRRNWTNFVFHFEIEFDGEAVVSNSPFDDRK
jgi:hypothetical protein